MFRHYRPLLALAVTFIAGCQPSSQVNKSTTFSFITADGSTLPGSFDVIPGDAPTQLVVFAHGHHEPRDVFETYLETGHPESITQPGVATLAISYRDDQGFPILRGAQDLIHATGWAVRRWPSIRHVILFGASMGGAVSGTAISELARPGNQAVMQGRKFNAWVDASGIGQLNETALEAMVIMPSATAEIQRDFAATGDDSYSRRSPAMNAANMKMAGLEQARLIHAMYDGIVPWDQAVQVQLALLAVGIPVSLNTLTCVPDDVPAGGTLFDDAGTVLPPAAPPTRGAALLLSGCDPATQTLAGHVESPRPDNPSMASGLIALRQLLEQTP